MYQAKYLDEVLIDIQQAKTWYKEQQEGLEERFALAIEEAILKVLEMPSAYAVRYRNIRIAHPRFFPYNIHFTLAVKPVVWFLRASFTVKEKTA